MDDHLLNLFDQFSIFHNFLLHLGHGTTFLLTVIVIFTGHQRPFYQWNLKLNTLIDIQKDLLSYMPLYYFWQVFNNWKKITKRRCTWDIIGMFLAFLKPLMIF